MLAHRRGHDAGGSVCANTGREDDSRMSAQFAIPSPGAGVERRSAAAAWRVRLRSLDMVIIAVCVLLIGTLWVVVVTRARIERQDTLAAAITANDNGAATFEQYTVRTIDNADALLQAVKREYARSGALTDLYQLLSDFGIGADAYRGLGIIDEHGDLVMTTMRGIGATVNFSDREHFSVHAPQDTGKLFVGRPVLSRLLGVMTIPLTRRINKADGSFGGVVVAQIEPSRFIDISQDATLRANDVLSLVGLDGITRARRVGDRRSAGEDLSKSPLISQWQDSASGHFAAAGTLDGVPRLYSYRRLRDYPLVVTQGRAEHDVFAKLDALHAHIEAVAAALTAFIAVMAALLIVALHRKQRAVLKLADSEARLSATFNQASVGIVVTRSDGRFLQVNQKFCDIVGYSPAEMLQRTVRDITHADDVGMTEAYYAELVAPDNGVHTVDREKRYIHKDGTTVWAAVSAASAHDLSGRNTSIVGTIQDVTQRKRQEVALKQASERLAQQSRMFDTSLSALSDFAYTMDTQGRFLYANASLLNLWGLPLADVVGKDFFDLRYPHDQAALLQRQLQEVVEHKRNVIDEMRYVDPSGAANDYEYIFNPVFAPDGSVETIAGVSRDVTERNRVENALRAREQEQTQLAAKLDLDRERLIEAQAVAKVGSWEMNLATLAVIWSKEVHRIFETDPTSFCPTQLAFLSFVHPADRARVEAALVAPASETAACAVEHRIVMPDGRIKIVEERWQTFRDPRGDAVRALGTCQDITERTEAQDHVRLQADLLAAVGQAVIAADLEGRILYSNQHAEELYGCVASDMLGRPLLEVVRPNPSNAAAGVAIAENFSSGARWSGELNVMRQDGTPLPIQLAISPIHDKSGALIGTIGVAADITERKAYENRIEYLATHDALTDLPNRNLLDDRLAQAIGHGQRTGESVAVMFLDLDNFKFVNDGYGHPVGDGLLKAIGERLRQTVRSADTIARLGGDEFVVLATDLADPLVGASAVARGVIDAFARPFTVDGREFSVTVSVGISLYPVDGSNLDELLKNADAAMYRAKDNGRNGYQFYAAEMSQKAIARVTMELGLRQALQLEQFELHYQPLVEMSTGALTGVEALIRWRHPELGMISPNDFIPLAEETGLIVPIGDWVLKTACAQNKAWQDAGLPALTVGVNLSAFQLQQSGFVAGVERVLAETRLDGRYLNLELTESMVMGTTGAVVASLERLRGLGVSLSMDDFGTGYSNLGHLTHLPLDILKIDRSFIRDVPGHHGAESIARAIVSMGHSLGMRVVAEGVETVAQMEFLRSIWCEYAQGYLFCKPLGAIACAAWIRERIANPALSKPPRGRLIKRVA
jgi:diguanylate cyclase (GGDEF)-like protein/PAS domain S-box-containing protein